MNRPLLISDCDEVLLHMARHFGEWVGAEHDIDFALTSENFASALSHRGTGAPVETDRMWELLNLFFGNEMHRQTLVPGVIEALGQIGELADILILTNLGDQYHPHRVAQLDAHGIRHDVICNQGGKGRAVAKILAERAPGTVLFVDDLTSHHASVARHAPSVWRLHMIADPEIARLIPPAPAAHKRIDDWAMAAPWALERLAAGPAA